LMKMAGMQGFEAHMRERIEEEMPDMDRNDPDFYDQKRAIRDMAREVGQDVQNDDSEAEEYWKEYLSDMAVRV
jgi:uncharacterized protein with ATP-grasp and redox domains